MTNSTVAGIDWIEVEEAFYRMMVKGWVSNVKPEPGHHPGSKHFSLLDGKYRLNDEWMSFPGGTKSMGRTIMYLDSAFGTHGHVAARYVPIWGMQYAGEYTSEQAGYVKQMLAMQYGAGRSPVFSGCRGPTNRPLIDEENKLVYMNRVDSPKMTFQSFSGIETVVSGGGMPSGYHRYSGMTLV